MIPRTLLFIMMTLLGPFRLAWAENWPQWRGPERTGVSKEKGLLESWPAGGPKLLWTFREAGAGHSSMSIVGNRLYSMGSIDDKDCVYAIDLKTRKMLWSVVVSGCFHARGGYGGGPRSTPTIDGKFLYALSGYGDLVCVERIKGRKIWSQGLVTDLGGEPDGDGYTESPLVDGDQVVATIGGEQGAIVAFDKKTGKLKWRCPVTEKRAFSSMIAIEVGGVRQYVQLYSYGGGIVGVRASDGELLWEIPHIGGACTPIFRNDRVYQAGTAGCLLFQLMPDADRTFKIEQIYTNSVIQNYYGGVVLVGDHVYGWSGSGWTCQEFKTGKRAWTKSSKLGDGSVVYADGNLYGYHENKGDVLLIKATPKSYQEQGRFRIPEETQLPRNGGRIFTHPVVANGRLYLRDQDLIFCYDVRKPH